jgi:hypothetical protein
LRLRNIGCFSISRAKVLQLHYSDFPVEFGHWARPAGVFHNGTQRIWARTATGPRTGRSADEWGRRTEGRKSRIGRPSGLPPPSAVDGRQREPRSLCRLPGRHSPAAPADVRCRRPCQTAHSAYLRTNCSSSTPPFRGPRKQLRPRKAHLQPHPTHSPWPPRRSVRPPVPDTPHLTGRPFPSSGQPPDGVTHVCPEEGSLYGHRDLGRLDRNPTRRAGISDSAWIHTFGRTGRTPCTGHR